MISKGKARADAMQLGGYLIDNAKQENETVRILEVRSGTTRDVKAALLDMELANDNTRRGQKPLYHMQISPAKGEDYAMTVEDWLLTVDNHEKALQFDGQERVIVLHEKRGNDGELRIHAHVVWSRVKDGKLLPISHNYLKHDQAREQSEKQLGHKRTRQPKDIKSELSLLWYNSLDGQDFVQKATAKGYKIGRGERRAYVVITPDGDKLDLVRQLNKVKTQQVKDRFQDIEASLPHEKQLAGNTRETERQNQKRQRTRERRQQANDNSKTATTPKPRIKITAQYQENARALAAAAIREKAREAGQTLGDITTDQRPAAAPAVEKQPIQDIAKQATQEKAREAGQTIKDISTTSRPAPEPPKNQTPKSWAEQVKEFRENQKAGTQEKSKQAGENFRDVTGDETPTQRRIREALDNLKNDDFGHEYEL